MRQCRHQTRDPPSLKTTLTDPSILAYQRMSGHNTWFACETTIFGSSLWCNVFCFESLEGMLAIRIGLICIEVDQLVQIRITIQASLARRPHPTWRCRDRSPMQIGGFCTVVIIMNLSDSILRTLLLTSMKDITTHRNHNTLTYGRGNCCHYAKKLNQWASRH